MNVPPDIQRHMYLVCVVIDEFFFCGLNWQLVRTAALVLYMDCINPFAIDRTHEIEGC